MRIVRNHANAAKISVIARSVSDEAISFASFAPTLSRVLDGIGT